MKFLKSRNKFDSISETGTYIVDNLNLALQLEAKDPIDYFENKKGKIKCVLKEEPKEGISMKPIGYL